MQILWLNHPTNPSLNGTAEDVARSVAEPAIYFKQAEAIPPIRRGDKGWLEQRNAAARRVTKPSEYDTPASTPGVSWGILRLKQGAAVSKNVNGTTTFYDAPPADCPAGIANQWADAVSVISPEAAQYAREKAIQNQLIQQQQEKTATGVTVLSALFGKKPL